MTIGMPDFMETCRTKLTSRPISGCPASTMQARLPSIAAFFTSAVMRSTSCMMSGPGGGAPARPGPPPRAGNGGSRRAELRVEVGGQLKVLMKERRASSEFFWRVVLEDGPDDGAFGKGRP